MTRRRPQALADAEVVERSLREPEMFAALFDRHAPRIHRYIARRVGRDAADDLVAETFLAAFATRRRYDARTRDAGPWLYGIATNLVGQRHRDELRQFRIRQSAALDPDPVGHGDRVLTEVTARGLREPLNAALAGLAREERDVLILIAWELLSYDETARALGVPTGTVRSRLHRARTRLRAALTEAGLGEPIEEILSND